MGVHGHHHTMNMNISSDKTNEWLDKLKETIDEYNVHFLVGDFNMSLMEVVPRLKARGLEFDTCSWYPWLHEETHARGHCLGMDSCAIFYIGGNVHCKMPWDIDSIGDLLKAAACHPAGPQSRQTLSEKEKQYKQLDTYSGTNVSGQLWNLYKSKNTKKANEFTLERKLTDLLEPSTSRTAVAAGQPRQLSLLPAYLRLRQKPLNNDEWLVDAETG